MNAQPPEPRHRGAFSLPVRPRFDGPVALELRAGLARIAREVRIMTGRVIAQRALRAVDREQFRAARELTWLRHELKEAERNWEWLQREYTERRLAQYRRLDSLSGDPQ